MVAAASMGVIQASNDAQLIDLNARVYDPALRKFLTPDQIIADISNSQAWNPGRHRGVA
jgi:hypothetical protein